MGLVADPPGSATRGSCRSLSGHEALLTCAFTAATGWATENCRALLRPSERRPRVTTTSSTYTDVVLHRLWSVLHTQRLDVPTVSTVSPTAEHRSAGQKLSVLGVLVPVMRAREEERDMHCPYCRHTDTRVLDSRVNDDGGAIRRRRSCPECGKRFSTVEQMQLVVVKRSGTTEPFTREKAVAGVRKACKGRPVSEDDLSGSASRSRTPSVATAGPRCRPTRSGWRSWRRCASSTRWPTSGSPASTTPSSRPTTSRPRSRCSEPSATLRRSRWRARRWSRCRAPRGEASSHRDAHADDGLAPTDCPGRRGEAAPGHTTSTTSPSRDGAPLTTTTTQHSRTKGFSA